jgi:hypothetical protein
MGVRDAGRDDPAGAAALPDAGPLVWSPPSSGGKIMKFESLAAAVAVSIAACAPASFAHAGIYADDLSKCLVKSTSRQDQNELVVWVYLSMSAHPLVQPYAKVDEAQRDASNRKAAAQFERLLTKDCRAEAVAALKYEGASAIEPAFGTLGQVAMRGLMGDAAVQKSMSSLGTYADTPALRAMLADAGMPVKDEKKAPPAPK